MERECYGAPAISVIARPLFGRLEAMRESVVEGLAPLRTELQRLEAQLGDRAWLVGDAISAADVFVFPMIKRSSVRLTEAGRRLEIDHGLGELATSLPRLAAWVARIEALPGCAGRCRPLTTAEQHAASPSSWRPRTHTIARDRTQRSIVTADLSRGWTRRRVGFFWAAGRCERRGRRCR